MTDRDKAVKAGSAKVNSAHLRSLEHACLWLFMPPIDAPSLNAYISGGSSKHPAQQAGRYRYKLPVWDLTGGYCFYCSSVLTFHCFEPDHVVPRSRGGSNDIGNLVPACSPCNASKCNRSYSDWIKLIRSGRSKRAQFVALRF